MNAADRQEMRELLERIQIIETDVAAAELIDQLAASSKPTIVSFINQYGFNLACGDAGFRTSLARSDVLLRDGVGMEFSLWLAGLSPGLNTNGTDLIPRILLASGGRRVMLIGTRDPWLSRAVQRMGALGIVVVDAMDGFQPLAAYVERVRSVQPDIVVLGMGMPHQERLAVDLARLPEAPGLIINGGAIIDFHAERFPRAPLWMRRARLEWLFRLGQEPRRLAGRYLVGGPVFLFRAVQMRGRAVEPRRAAVGEGR